MTTAIPPVRRRRSFQSLPFARSASLSIGTEVEVVLVHTTDGMPAAASPEVLGLLALDGVGNPIKAELTQAMVEITSGIHARADTLGAELYRTAETLQAYIARLGLAATGGGVHPFCDWCDQVIFPTPRFQRIADTYGYLARQFAVLSQHVHIGCASGDEALYLAHALARYVPHLVALTAASPLWRGIDTGFDCSRLNIVRTFPLSGHAPPLQRWSDFSAYIARLHEAGVIESMKDLYWDIRPKPELGTVEIRVCDAPLSIASAADVVALIQTLARWLLVERQEPDLDTLYLYYDINRFRAARYGLAAECIDTVTGATCPLADSVRITIDALADHASALNNTAALQRLRRRAERPANDASWLRALAQRTRDPDAIMRAAAARWLERAPACGGD